MVWSVVLRGVSWALIAAPALLSLWLGRRLVRHMDDPVFPELRFARIQRLTVVFAVSLSASLMLDTDSAVAKILLALLFVIVADYPSRRVIFNETRGLPAYVAHTLRLWVAMFGVWILLALTPGLVLQTGVAAAWIAAGIGLVVVLGSHFGSRLFVAIVGAAPLRPRGLETVFETILARARCPRPRLFEAAAPGGLWVNAFALPSLHGSAVLFTEDLLRALTPAEAGAIFAHELAHLEYFDRRRLILRDVAVVVLAAVTPAVLFVLTAESTLARSLVWVWPLACLLALTAAQSGNQAIEHRSDLRALELVGDPEPLISALTKIHRLMALPRRWHHKGETRQSHPSLAARVRAIREAARMPVAAQGPREPLAELVVRGADRPTEVAVLAADRLHWLRGVEAGPDAPTTALLERAGDRRSIRYEDLADLRLEVRGASRRLKAVDYEGRTLELALQPQDVGAVKARLERLELRVRGTRREVSAAMAGAGKRRLLCRLWGIIAVLSAALPPFSLPLGLAGLLTVVRPVRTALAATAVIALSVAVFATRGAMFEYVGPLQILIQLALATFLLIELWRSHRAGIEETRGSARPILLVLGATATLYLLAALPRLASPMSWMQLHLWSRYSYGVVVVLLGLAAALLANRPRRVRRGAALAAVALAALLVFSGTLWFRDAMGQDSLARRSAPLDTTALALERLRTTRVQGPVTRLRVSPGGRRLAYSPSPAAAGFHVELDGGGTVFVAAVDLAFLDDDRVARLVDADGRLALETLPAGADSGASEEILLPWLPAAKLRVDSAAGRWEVASTDFERRRGVLLSGRFGRSEFRRSEWGFDEREDSYLTDLSMGSSSGALAVHGHFDLDGPFRLWSLFVPWSGYAAVWELHVPGEPGRPPLARTALSVHCLEPAPGQLDFVCATYDPEALTRLWLVDAAARRVDPLGSLPGFYSSALAAGPERILLRRYDNTAALVDLRGRQVWLLETGTTPDFGPEAAMPAWLANLATTGADDSGVAVRESVLALSAWSARGTEVTVYRMPPARLSASGAPRVHGRAAGKR